MGLLEARNLDFKAKIITSLNEGSFPPPEGKDIFLNSRVRKSAGLPSAADRETLYKYMFEELTLSSDFCYISYKSDASFIFEKSRFVEKLIKNGINKKPASTRHFLPFCPESKVEFLFTEVKKGDLVEQLKNLTYTPSMIKDFLECSYRFYIKHILRIAESPEIMEELERRDYGNLLHRVMNRFFKIEEFKYGISPLLEKKGFEAVVRLISEEVNKEANLSAADRMAFELLKGEMRRWVKKEALLFKKGHRVEGEFSESRIDVILLCNGLSIKLSGRPDRVNSFNGGYYLIDYKVKNLPTSNEMLINESFKEVQLPFYGLLLMLSRKLDYSEIKGLAYYDLKKDFSLTEVLSESSAGYMQSFKTFLEEIFTSLFNTETPFSLTEDRKNCRYCSFPGICRVKQK